MIVITSLDVWVLTAKGRTPGAGNQSLYNTLLGYGAAGWDVQMLTVSTGLAGTAPIHPNVTVYRKPILFDRMLIVGHAWAKSVLRALRRRPVDQKVKTASLLDNRNLRIRARIFTRVMASRAVALARRLGGVEMVYGHEIFGVLAGRIAADRLRVPLVTRFQGTELGELLDQPQQLLASRTKVRALRTPADLIIMTNDGTRGDEVLDFLGVPKERYRFYLNGVVKGDVYRPNVDAAGIRRKLGIPDGSIFVLYTGRMFYWKRIDRHLEVLRRVRDRVPNFRAVFIGDGPELEPAQALCRRLGLDDCVTWLGAMAHSQVMDYLNACDVYISFHDLTNLCNPVLEACVCGKCIVTTAVGGTKDLLTDGVDASLVETHDDVEVIAERLARVLVDGQERARLAAGAKRRGESLWTWAERMKVELAEVDKVLARNAGS